MGIGLNLIFWKPIECGYEICPKKYKLDCTPLQAIEIMILWLRS